MGQYNRTKHSKVLSALEKRALQFKARFGRDELKEANEIDETGTVATAELTDGESG